MNLLLTLKCNRSCKFCFQKSIVTDPQMPDFIPIDNVKKVIEFLKASQMDSIDLLGGEPTLHPEIIPIMELLKGEGFNITLITNGLYQPNLREALSKHIQKFLINYDNPSEYSKTQLERLNANISAIDNSVREIKQPDGRSTLFTPISLAVTFYKPDQEYMYLFDAAERFGVKSIRFDLARPSALRSNNFVPFERLSEFKHLIISFLKEAVTRCIHAYIDCSLPPCIFNKEELFFLTSWLPQFRTICSGPIDILPDLSVWFCSSLSNAWEAPKLTEFKNKKELFDHFWRVGIKKLRSTPPQEDCLSCKLFLAYCQGYCLGDRLDKRKVDTLP